MNRLVLGLVPAIVLGSAALRRHGDLGDTVPTAAFWAMLAASVLMLAAIAPRSAACASSTHAAGGVGFLPATLGLLCLLAIPAEPAIATGALGTCWLLARRAAGRGGRHALAESLEFALFGLLAMVAATWFTDAISLLRVSSSQFASLVATAFELLGVESASSGAEVLVQGPRMEQGFLATANHVGLVPHLAIAGVLVGLRLANGPGAGLAPWPAAIGYLPTALLLRFALFMSVGIAIDHGVEYDNPDFHLAAALDWRVGLALDLVAGVASGAIWLRSRAALATSSSVDPHVALRPLVVVAAAVAGVLWSSDRIFDAFGQPAAATRIRIAMDELHSHWESSDIRLTRDHYGQESGYNFRGLCDWLEGAYGPIRRLYDPLSDAALAEVDVLVVKTPTQAFAPAEQAAIDRFVKAGGGLVLIGDHTNVYGTSEILNSLAEPVGFRFVYDCCFDQRSRFELRYVKETQVANHPTLAGLDEILFEVGCTIDIDSPRVRPILVGRALKSQPIDYGVENYYGKPRDRSEQECGQFPLLVVANSGHGRVVAVADSTLFSTFSVFIPGRREIVEGMIAYASGHDVGAGIRDLAWRCAIGISLLLLLLMPGLGLRALLTCGLVAWGASNLAATAAEVLVYPGHPDLPTANAPATVTFLREDESVEWPTLGFVQDPGRSFSLFYQFVSRVGAYPRLVADLAEATRSQGPMVWIDPVPTNVERTTDELIAFASAGGTVVLMEREPRPLLGAVAQRVGLQVLDSANHPDGAALLSRFGRASGAGAVPRARSIVGGQPLLRVGAAAPHSVAAVAEVGRGNVVILTCGAMFTDANYGFRYGAIPNAELRRLYEVQYSVLQAAVRKRE
ncbi:MAG: hypothetical protein JNK49_13685 [Planctomycetes bacterium]|nr:hypothetical protein [Planctomycetota bacterium]